MIQKYDLDAESSSMGGFVEMRPCEFGAWILAEDAQKLEKRIEELEKELAVLIPK